MFASRPDALKLFKKIRAGGARTGNSHLRGGVMANAARGIGSNPVVWRFGLAVLCTLALLIISIPGCWAQTEPAVPRQGSTLAPQPALKAISERMNANTLTLVTRTPSSIL